MHPIALVLNGASSSGKTSVARALQEIWPDPLIHASLDAFTDVFRWAVIHDEDARRNCHSFGIVSFHEYLRAAAGSTFSIVVDHVFEQHAWYESTRDALRSRPTLFVGVRCELEVLIARERARGDRKAGLSRWQHQRVHLDKHYDIEVDTTALGAAECAALILAKVQAICPG